MAANMYSITCATLSTCGWWALAMWLPWIEMSYKCKIHTRVQRQYEIKNVRDLINIFLDYLYVEIIIFWIYWVKYNILLKLTLPGFFVFVFRLLKMWLQKSVSAFVAHILFLFVNDGPSDLQSSYTNFISHQRCLRTHSYIC